MSTGYEELLKSNRGPRRACDQPISPIKAGQQGLRGFRQATLGSLPRGKQSGVVGTGDWVCGEHTVTGHGVCTDQGERKVGVGVGGAHKTGQHGRDNIFEVTEWKRSGLD